VKQTVPRWWLTGLSYGLMLAAGVGLFLVIRAYGEALTPPAQAETPAGPTAAAPKAGPALLHILIALVAVITLGRLLAWLFARIGQPPVIGEVVAGILLGPSLIGADASAWILPPSVAPHLGVIAQLGVILYMFLVGLELNPGLLRAKAQATLAISHTSIVVPFTLGAALALVLYPILSHEGVPFTSFALFMGVAMAITAFPVLARILQDRGLDKTELGVMALGCAAIDDVTAWCLLAFVVGVAQARLEDALLVTSLALGFVALMFLLVRPLARRLARNQDATPVGTGAVACTLVAALLAALTTEAIGIHAIFGAFLLGAMIPHDSRIAREVKGKIQDVVTILLLPAFFAYTGMRTQIALVASPEEWLLCGWIVVAATVGKFGGAMFAAKLSGFDTRTAAALGILMNTRGLMELIVLNIGLDLGVISPQLFAMMVLMALATTVATTPLLMAAARQGRPPFQAGVGR
jgi:Kef-type K+ transport system membrane component KefB